MLENILLGFLQYGPLTGYDIKCRLEGSTGHFWHAYHSQIYTTLRKLENDGLLTSQLLDEDAGRLSPRLYTLTAAGHGALRAWLDQPQTELSPIKEPLLVRLFFSNQRPLADVLAELRVQRTLHQRQLEIYHTETAHSIRNEVENHPTSAGEARFWQFTLDFGVGYQQLYLAWLDQVIAQLEQLQAQP